MKYFLSILFILIGLLMTIKSERMLKMFGYSEWAETKLASWGGSRTFYKLLGLIFVFGAVMYLTGWLQDILISIFNPGNR